jgi:hypothetical protein
MDAVSTVRCALTTEVVALHRSGETLALAHGSDVNELASGERVDFDFLANFETINAVETKLENTLASCNASLFEVTAIRAVQLAGLLLTEGDLQCVVAIAFDCLDLHDAHRSDVQHGHGYNAVCVIPYLCHADFFADYCFVRHNGNDLSVVVCVESDMRGRALHANARHGKTRPSACRLCCGVSTEVDRRRRRFDRRRGAVGDLPRKTPVARR